MLLGVLQNADEVSPSEYPNRQIPKEGILI